jgi:hypothetical protein
VKNVNGQNVERKNAEWDTALNGKNNRLGQNIEDKKH